MCLFPQQNVGVSNNVARAKWFLQRTFVSVDDLEVRDVPTDMIPKHAIEITFLNREK